MTPNRIFILIAALAALLAGMQMSRQGCPACVLLSTTPEAAPGHRFEHNLLKP
jgi:hypothetical protein